MYANVCKCKRIPKDSKGFKRHISPRNSSSVRGFSANFSGTAESTRSLSRLITLDALSARRASAWKNPLEDNCEFLDWALKFPKACSIGNSESRATPLSHGFQHCGLESAMTTHARAQLWSVWVVCDAMKQLPFGSCIASQRSSLNMRNTSKRTNPARANSVLWPSFKLLCNKGAVHIAVTRLCTTAPFKHHGIWCELTGPVLSLGRTRKGTVGVTIWI